MWEGAKKIYHGRHVARGRRVGQGWGSSYLEYKITCRPQKH
jgi:hypothetical protein